MGSRIYYPLKTISEADLDIKMQELMGQQDESIQSTAQA